MSEKPAGKKVTDCFYGTVTVGERGQIVIPAEARRDHNIETGDKLLIIGDPDKHHLHICKADAMMAFLESMLEGIKMAQGSTPAPPTGSTPGDTPQ
ncbi:MAG TPA: AbrB/MazE/SpoVT family DNA-binding domain-containing protein [Capsulimonadaceae bacterium]|jgi:AbrB family looped-hinge helix DNA binding protein